MDNFLGRLHDAVTASVQQAEIAALKEQVETQKKEFHTRLQVAADAIAVLNAQVAMLVAAAPSAGSRAPQFGELDAGEKAAADLPETIIVAIKLYRNRTGCTLYEAKQAVDAYRFGRATR